MVPSDEPITESPFWWASEESCRRLIELLPDIVFGLSADEGRITSLNLAFERLTGFSRAEWIGHELTRLIHPEDVTVAREMIERARRGETVPPQELRFPTEKGGYRKLEVIGQPYLEGGKVTGIIGCARDVTEGRAAEAAFRWSEHSLRVLIEGVKDHALFLLDPGGHVMSWNASGERLFGYKAEEILGRPFSCFYSSDDIGRGAPEAHLRHAEIAGQVENEGWRVRKDGARFWAVTFIATLPQGEDVRRGFACVIRDLTAHKQTSEAVRATQQWLHHLLSSSPAVIYSGQGEDEYCTVFVSENVLSQLGYHPWEFLKNRRLWVSLLHPDDVQRVLGARERLKETGHQVLEYRLRHGAGGYRWVRDEVRVIRDAEDAPMGIVGCWIDITERKQVEEQLERSLQQLRALSARLHSVREEERTRIAREIHDELGQALTGLKMDLSWLARHLPADAPELQRKVESMSQLVDATIHVVRRISTELRPGVLDDLGLLAAIEWQAHEFQTRTGIRCRLRARREDLDLDADRATAVFRIFQETLTNVARHARATEVVVRLDVGEQQLTLEVKDNGIGISAEALADPHSLGLLGMRERALVFGGRLDVRGEPGRGTTVTVTIPFAGPTDDHTAHAPAADPKSKAHPRGTPITPDRDRTAGS